MKTEEFKNLYSERYKIEANMKRIIKLDTEKNKNIEG